MAEKISYAILGRGRWAARMHAILASDGRHTRAIEETRARESETGEAHQARIYASLRQSGAQIAWLCVPPGPHVSTLARAALDAGLHAVIEKPWLGSSDASRSLLAFAQQRGLRIAVHYEYCLLDAVADWRRNLRDSGARGRRVGDGAGFRFGGRFQTSRANHLNLPALENLGSHLLAIRAYAAPKSIVSEIDCGYERPDERRVWLETSNEPPRSIDFLENREPIIQRFVRLFEPALGGSDFPFDLNFAQRVADDVHALKNPRAL